MTTSAPPTPPPTRTWTLRRRLGRSALALAVVIGVLVAGLMASMIGFAVVGNRVIYNLQPATSASSRVLADLVNQETGVRGYILGRQARYLQPYYQYLAQQRDDVDRIRTLMGDDAAAMRRLDAVEQAASVWQQQVAIPLISEVSDLRTPDPGQLDAGATRFDAIRVRAAALTALLRSRTTDARTERSWLGWLSIAVVAVGVTVISAAGVLVWRGLHRWVLRPVESLAGQTRTVASGDLDNAIRPGGPAEMTALGTDVEAMREQLVAQLAIVERARRELERRGDELARSNADLQQFAYVASHDLSEPLRKVANFCQLLERQYGDQLDDRARVYIGYAVDGAKRMQALIGDLLSLSRVGRTTESFEPVDLNVVLDQACATLADRIGECGARVDADPLPVVSGDRSLLISLFENLVGNAVKYRRDDVAPRVTVHAAPAENGMCTLTVADNGIGIDAQYAERIFAVFQRLHLRDQYGGTGIGLALCRRIVEFHGGRIRLDTTRSQPGSCFVVTFPEGARGGQLPRPEPASAHRVAG